jgi:DNA-directed RNA polymerase beta subunit
MPDPLQPQPDSAQPAMREFTDAAATRKNIFDGVMDGLRTTYPLRNDSHELHLENLRYDDPKEFSLADQKRAILQQQTLDWKVKGDWVLKDRGGNELHRVNKVIARVPYMTPRGTFVFRGSEYTVANQQRLRPGVYARKKDNGELESHVNLLPGSGHSFRLHMEPDTGTFKIQVGQSHVPVFALLKALGASDGEISAGWGPDLYSANAAKDDPSSLRKIFDRLGDPRTRAEHRDNVAAGLRHVFNRMQLDPEVSQRNLGRPYSAVDKDVLLRATQKLLNIHRGVEEPDDRDSQANQTLHGPEDLFKERITKDAGRLARQAMWRASFSRNLNHVKSGLLTPQLHGVLLSSGLGQPLSEINPVEIADQMLRVSRLGEGGIPGVDAIPGEARNVQPSQLGYVDPVLGPESEKIGVDARLASGTVKGSDGLLYSRMLNPRTGQVEHVPARKAVHATVAFPGELDNPAKRKVRAMVGGRIRYVDRDRVDYAVQHPEHMFSLGSNLVPGVSGIKGGRLLMAGKMIRQALPLKDAEAPLVRSAHPEGGSYESRVSERVGAVKAPAGGVVSRVTPQGVTVRHDDDGTEHDYELYDHFPFNTKTFIHNTPAVTAGQRVEAGQLLAGSNYTDRQGNLALGKNLSVAYLPYQTKLGNNYEDAIVISEGGARKLTSEHMYQHAYDPTEPGKQVGKRGFVSLFPGEFDRRQLDTIDASGSVQPGTVVRQGDPLVLAVHNRKPTVGAQLHKSRKNYTAKDALVWQHKHEGVVTDVSHDADGIKVTVKSYQPMGVGDKMANRYGGKGVVGAVIPDDQMPKDADGNPLDVVLNPLGVISRTNPMQMVETALGKIAAKTGKPYELRAFDPGRNLVRYAQDELRKHGLSDTDTVYDPATNRHLKNVFTGRQFFYKLYHTAETKETGRGDSGAYTAEGQPAKGGPEGAKRLGLLDINALISHGATEVLRDAKLIRGQRNDDFWRAFRMGHPAPVPRTPMVFDKFLAHLKGAGINVVRDGPRLHVTALTDDDVNALSSGPLAHGDAVDVRSNLPIPGGLFDVGLTGGHHGTRWSHVELQEPMPNPVMEEPVRRLLGMTKAQFQAKLKEPDGPGEIRRRLQQTNLDQAIDLQKQLIRSGKKTKRDNAVKLLGTLTMARDKDLHPGKWMLSNVPVLPPAFRPVTMVNGMQMTSDANLLYKDLFEANRNLKDHLAEGLDPGEARLGVYNAMKAVSGLGDPINLKSQEKGVGGLLQHVFGKGSPKFGMFQRKVLSNTLDVVGRAAITPDPAMDMDHVGLPESKAWTIYRPFIMRRLAKQYNVAAEGGERVPMTEIARWIVNKDPRAQRALHDEINERPVLINRAPVWHRYGFMAAYPVLVPGETLHISPITTPGFGADFDGDAMNYSVPVTDEAVKEPCRKCCPAATCFRPRTSTYTSCRDRSTCTACTR